MCVAQLDRALGYGPRCRGFESSHAREVKEASMAESHACFFYDRAGECSLNYAYYFANLMRMRFFDKYNFTEKPMKYWINRKSDLFFV